MNMAGAKAGHDNVRGGQPALVEDRLDLDD